MMAEVVPLTGKIDLAAVAEMHSAIVAHQDSDIICDLEAVTQIGALGLQVLIAASLSAEANGKSFAFSGLSDRVRDQLTHMGLDIETLTKGTT